jgi:hypothetical protein
MAQSAVQGTSKIKMTPAQYAKLQAAERGLLDALPEMDMMEQVGMDVSGYRVAVQDMLSKISKMKQFYAP